MAHYRFPSLENGSLKAVFPPVAGGGKHGGEGLVKNRRIALRFMRTEDRFFGMAAARGFFLTACDCEI